MPPLTELQPNKSEDEEIIESDEEEDELPTGVYTLLTDCYSSTCSISSLCYSVLCPRRFNQVCTIKN